MAFWIEYDFLYEWCLVVTEGVLIAVLQTSHCISLEDNEQGLADELIV